MKQLSERQMEIIRKALAFVIDDQETTGCYTIISEEEMEVAGAMIKDIQRTGEIEPE